MSSRENPTVEQHDRDFRTKYRRCIHNGCNAQPLENISSYVFRVVCIESHIKPDVSPKMRAPADEHQRV